MVATRSSQSESAQVLELLQGVVLRLDRIEGKLDEHSEAIEQLNHTGILAKVEEESKCRGHVALAYLRAPCAACV